MTSGSGSISRRALLGTAAAGLTMAASRAAAGQGALPASVQPTALPVLEEFPTVRGVHLNGGAVHPPPAGAIRAMEDYIHSGQRGDSAAVIAAFGRLINADPGELAYVQSTTMGENMVVRALGLPQKGGRIVTDALHFYGSFYIYNELEKAGMEVIVVPFRDNRIRMDDLEAAVNGHTRLVALSAISTVNGFQHDLGAVTKLAHAHGALVYVDAIHALGTVPLDVKATNIDFLASSTYKWLMGDMGTGFLYVRADLIPSLERPHYGYAQVSHFSSHALPYDTPGERPFVTRPREDAAGLFAGATMANDGIVRLGYTLPWLERIGIENIQRWRQPMVEHARRELPRLGLEPMTPEDSTGPILTFTHPDARAAFGDNLRDAGIQVALTPHRMRLSFSIYNSIEDVDRLINALSQS
jgi:selenocysteine lyase/cysteine desulfurase